MQRMNISLPDEIVRQFKRQIPAGKRSQFITKAVSEKLGKRNLKAEFRKSLKINGDYYQKIAKEMEEDFKYADVEILKKIP